MSSQDGPDGGSGQQGGQGGWPGQSAGSQGGGWGGQPVGGQAPGGWGGQPAGWRAPYADAPPPGPVPVRPMTLGELLDAAFKLLRADFGAFLLAVGAVVIPTQILLTALSASFSTDLFATLEANPDAFDTVLNDVSAVLPGFVLVAVVSEVLLLLAAAAVIRIGAARYLGGTEGAADALRAAGRRALALIGSRLLIGLLIMAIILIPIVVGVVGAVTDVTAVAVVGFVAAVPATVLAFYLYVGFLLSVPAIMLEGAGAVASLGRSRRLVRGRWWPVFGIFLVANCVVGFVGLAVGGVFSAVGAALPTEWYGWVLTGIGAILTSLVVEPIIALVTLLLYADTRIRKEGLDLQLRTAPAEPGPGSLGAPGPAGWSPGVSPG